MKKIKIRKSPGKTSIPRWKIKRAVREVIKGRTKMMEPRLRQIEVLTNAWNTISSMFIRDDEELSKKGNIILRELTKQLLEKVDAYLKSGQVK